MRNNRAFILTILLLSAGMGLAQNLPCTGVNCAITQGNEDDSSSSQSGAQESAPSTSSSGTDLGNVSDTDLQKALLKVQTETEKTARSKAVCPGPQCPALPPEEKTEFQKFVFTTTGEKLPIYGHNLFKTSPTTFAPVDRVPVPADYVIGPGDELLVRVWGPLEINVRVTVDRNGQIFLPRAGTVSVAGVRYDQLNNHLKNALSRVFKNFDLNVTLGQLRSIQVYVVGQARRPGTYTISSLSTLVTALFAAGGPSANGSMRHIQLKRQNRVVTEFDIYDLLGKGDKSRDVSLLPGDVIYIPPVGKQIAMVGSVNLPAIYEIADKTEVRDQIAAAGGLSTTADGTHVVIERIDDRTTRSVQELKLDDGGLAEVLHDGDIVHVFPISPRVEGSIILRGNVAAPGRYPWKEGMKVADLIPSKEALITRDYWMRQGYYARRENGWKDPQPKKELTTEDDQDTTDLDRLAAETPLPGTEHMTPAQRVALLKRREQAAADKGWSDGKMPDDHTDVITNMTDINWDYAVVQRLNNRDLSSELVTFDLERAIEDHGSADNLALRSGDVITIFSQQDVAVPAEKRTKFVWIEGEVNSPGVYRAKPGETLRELVERAGGLSASAYLFAAEFRRVSTMQEQQKEMDRLIENAERDLRNRARLTTGGLNAEDKLAAQQELQYERAAIDKLRTLQVTGRIVLGLKPSDVSVAEVPAVQLEDGDRFIIPPKPATVGVVGAVYNQNTFLFDEQNSVKKYLSYAGGGTREADTGRMFIVRANGAVVSKQMHRSIWAGGFENFKLAPGDAVVMPEKLKSTNVLRGLRDWSQVFAQFALGVAALKTISP